MTHKAQDKVDILVGVGSVEALNKTEILFYEVSDTSLTSPTTSCSDPLNNECPITNLDINKDVTAFSILVVGVDPSEAVLQSTLLSFEGKELLSYTITGSAFLCMT